MPAKKHNRRTREAHLAKVAARFVRGQRLGEIAMELDVAPSQITYDLKILTDRWVKSQMIDMDAARATQLERITTLEAAAWTEWERSRQMREDTLTENAMGRQATQRARITRKVGLGDAEYLRTIQWCIAERSKLMGLYPKEGTGEGTGALTLALIHDVIRSYEDSGSHTLDDGSDDDEEFDPDVITVEGRDVTDG